MENLDSVKDILEYCQNIVKNRFKEDINYDIDFSSINGKMITAILKSIAENFKILKDQQAKLEEQMFLDTANEYYLTNKYGKIYNKYRLQALGSNGYILFQGKLTATIPANTNFYIGANTYSSNSLNSIQSYTINYNKLEERDNQIIVYLEQDFLLASGIVMKSIDGGYISKDKTIKAISTNSFSFEKDKDVEITEQSGSVVFEFAKIYVNSLSNGENTNAIDGTEIQLLNSISN